MKRTHGINVQVSIDSTGSMISSDWHCPYCHSTNYEIFFTDKIVDSDNGFEYDRECDNCGTTVTVMCSDIELGLLD